MRRGGGFGFVMLVVVTAIVLLLVARAWRELAAPAIETVAPLAAGAPDERAIGPGLHEARDATDAHADAVGAALEAID